MRCYFAPHDQPKLVKEALSNHGWSQTDSVADAALVYPRAGKHLGDWLQGWRPTGANQLLGVIPKYRILTCRRALWTQLELILGRERASSIIPESYLLDCTEHLDKLKDDMKSGGAWFVKCTKHHQRVGLSLASDWQDIEAVRHQPHMMAQRVVENALCVNRYRMSLRMYLTVTICEGRMQAFVHSKGKCLYTPNPFAGHLLDFNSIVTRSTPSSEFPFTLSDLKTFLASQDHDWKNAKQLINQMLIDVVSCVRERWQREYHYGNLFAFQFFGVDLILTDKLDAKLIEINPGPVLTPTCDLDEALKRDVIADSLEICK